MKELVNKLAKHLDWSWLPGIIHYTLTRAVEIQQIPAPTFHEEARAAYIADRFRELKLDGVHVDSLHNVYGLLPGMHRELPALMVTAHSDTVFAADTDLTIENRSETLHGPGLGDNSLGVGGILGLVAALQQHGFRLERDIWFVSPTREEGLGDLGGMRTAYNRLRERIGYVINVEGLAFGHVYQAGIAVRRFHITASAPGGHSWIHFGRPSATHAIVQLGAFIAGLDVPETPRTTFNIGMLEGGQGINVIATSAGLWLDVRSEDPAQVRHLEATIRQHIETLSGDGLTFSIEVVGDRPAGAIGEDHPLVEAAMAALTAVGVEGALQSGSTDGNIPLSQGCPAVTIGITRGAHAHRTDEYIETAYVESGMRQLILLVLAAAGYRNP